MPAGVHLGISSCTSPIYAILKESWTRVAFYPTTLWIVDPPCRWRQRIWVSRRAERGSGSPVHPRGVSLITFRSTSPHDHPCSTSWQEAGCPRTEGQDPLIYLVSSVETIAEAGLRWLFSDGNCAAYVTEIFDDLDLLDSKVDWEVMRAAVWKNTAEDPDRMRRRMAEFLVHERVPMSCLVGVAVRTAAMRDRVGSTLDRRRMALPVRVQPSWYY